MSTEKQWRIVSIVLAVMLAITVIILIANPRPDQVVMQVLEPEKPTICERMNQFFDNLELGFSENSSINLGMKIDVNFETDPNYDDAHMIIVVEKGIDMSNFTEDDEYSWKYWTPTTE